MRRGCSPVFLVVLAVGCGTAEHTASVQTRSELVRNLINWIAEADQNGDQRLDKLEWQALVHRDFPSAAEEDRQRWGEKDFAYYDSNGDGFVEAGELTAPSLVGFDCLDTDDDGRLTPTERVAAREATCLPTRTITE